VLVRVCRSKPHEQHVPAANQAARSRVCAVRPNSDRSAADSLEQHSHATIRPSFAVWPSRQRSVLPGNDGPNTASDGVAPPSRRGRIDLRRQTTHGHAGVAIRLRRLSARAAPQD
jgi:hypothetical protein